MADNEQPPPPADNVDDALADEAAELDGYFSDTPLDPQPDYPELDTSMDRSIIITNIPVVTKEKVDKLTKFVYKLVARIGTLVTFPMNGDDAGDAEGDDVFSGIHMPYNTETGQTYGFCFVEYETTEMATNAVEVLQNYNFDKRHVLTVTKYSTALALQDINTERFEPPKIKPFAAAAAAAADDAGDGNDDNNSKNPQQWLSDEHQRDEFCIRHGKDTTVYWWDAKPNSDPQVDYDGQREKEAGVQWCEYYCHWSPAGSYLATLVPARGVILWCGRSYEKAGRFVAPGVKHVVFSPQENYILTTSENPDDNQAVKIYHIQSGKLLRTFPLYPDGFLDSKKGKKGSGGDGDDEMMQTPPPPPFLWSQKDDAYVARMGRDLISIYELPTMKLLQKRSLSCPGICEFQWSPAKDQNILAYWAPEEKNIPAHVDIIEIPSRKKLRQKNLFNVTKCNMVWHDAGDFLAVKVTRHTKSKKTLYNNIELFRLREQGIPVEMLDTKEAVMALTWEPVGTRFAMIHAENPSASKVNVSFYDMMKPSEPGTKSGDTIAELHKVETLEGRQCNLLFWSPAGSTIIMASLGDSASGTLEFYNVDTKQLVVKEHYRANQVLWDPAGRSVATIVSQPIEGGHFRFAMDNGYILWSFQGKQLHQASFETFYQFVWRPRESLLSKSQIDAVKRNLKKYEKQFDKADRKRQRTMYLEETKGKRAERAKIREIRTRNLALQQKMRTERNIRRNEKENESNYIIRDVTVETVLSTKEDVIM